MRNALVVCGMTAVAMFALANAVAEEKADKPAHDIKEVMKVCMKGGLCKKVCSGQGSADDAKKLHGMLVALSQNTPPKGSADSWKKLTSELVAAAQDVVDEKDGAGARLKAAANCAACHKPHKGK